MHLVDESRSNNPERDDFTDNFRDDVSFVLGAVVQSSTRAERYGVALYPPPQNGKVEQQIKIET